MSYRKRVVGTITIVLAMCVAVYVVSELAKEGAQAAQRKANLNEIGYVLALHHSLHGSFPSIPGARVSWRVEILPGLELSKAFTRYDGEQDWDSPANLLVLNEFESQIFRRRFDRSQLSPRYTNFLAVYGDPTNASPRKLFFIEYPFDDIPWTKPQDLDLSDVRRLARLESWMKSQKKSLLLLTATPDDRQIVEVHSIAALKEHVAK